MNLKRRLESGGRIGVLVNRWPIGIERVRARLAPLLGRAYSLNPQPGRAVASRIDVAGAIKTVAMWTFALIELGLLIAVIVGGFLIFASTTKSAFIG